ncbi:MAG: S41 family peptidase, partial [Bauldia sp.]|nr:S41 family peptidase [Bauldia sp.]
MAFRTIARVALILVLPLAVAPAGAESALTGNPAFDRTVELVEKNFFDASALPAFRDTVAEVEAEAGQGAPLPLDEAINRILASLKATHTVRYTPDRIDYYELADVFRYAIRDNVKRLFPPEGKVAYEGIGIATKAIGGKLFVTDVYDGGPAAQAGLMAGDEVLSVDGAPFAEIGSFKGKAGGIVRLQSRRSADAAPVIASVKVERLQPLETFLKAMSDSIRIVERDGRRIGIIHLWSYTSDQVTSLLADELGGGRLKDVDGLILDLRSRWGGAPADAAEIFVGGTGDMTMTERDGDVRYVNTRWRKPVVAIIDEGTRSGMEILAYALKKNGIPLVGTKTAAAVVAGTGYILPDDSLLVLAVADVRVDGARLEGVGVSP